MQSASISTLKKELQQVPQEALVELCLRMAKYKKENKELLNYLLFENTHEQHYINSIKEMLETEFEKVNVSNLFFAKKGIRRILRLANKHIHYSGLTETEVQVLTHFCKHMKLLKIDFTKSAAMQNLYDNQLKKIRKSIHTLHEDLQYDYEKEMDKLS
jgi:uncharacterized protein YpuA (DUF1002 family)